MPAATTAPAGTSGPVDTGGPAASVDQGGADLSGSVADLADASSYKFKMTMVGSQFDNLLAMFTDPGSADTAPFTVTGTIVTSPETGADVTASGRHIIEIGGYDYLEQEDGSYLQTTMNGPGLVSGFSPQILYAGVINASSPDSFVLSGTDQKNGVAADHYQASSAFLDEYSSILGIVDATWAGDVWIAQDGGYPVSFAVIGKAKDGSVVFELSFELTNVNDPANQVTAPENVAGA